MKEREPIESELTQKADNLTLEVKGNIMPEPGGGDIPQPQPKEITKPKTAEDTVSHLAKIKVEGMEPVPVGSTGLPLEWNNWNLDIRRGWIELRRDHASEQLLSQQLLQREDPHAISPAQKEALDNVYKIIDDDPDAFADAYVRAIDTLSQKRAEPIVHGDAINLIKQVLEQAKTSGRISDESEERFLKRAQKALELTPPEFARKARRIIKDVAKEPQRLERKAAKKTTEEIIDIQSVVQESRASDQPPIEAADAKQESPQPMGEISDELRDYIIKSRDGASIGITNNLARILRANGYSDEEIDGFRNNSEVFKSTLEERFASDQQKERAKETSTPTEASATDDTDGSGVSPKPESAAGGGNGGEKPPAPPSSPSPEQPEEQSESSKKSLDPDDGEKISDSVKQATERIIAQLSPEETIDMEDFRSILVSAGAPADIATVQSADMIIRMRGRQRAESSEGYHLPESLEDFATLVMKSENDDWRTGGPKELIRDGKVVKEHLLAWIRKRAVEIDAFNPTSNINLFSDINVKFGYSQISLMEMVLTGSYFLKREKQPDGTYKTSKDDDYEKLKLEIINEAFLYNNDKNKWVTYKGKMHSEAELPELMISLYYADPNFRGDYLEQIMTLASTNAGKIQEIKDRAGNTFAGQEAKMVLEGNNDLGEGIRRAFLTYFHLGDYEMLAKMSEMNGKESFLFDEEYMEVNGKGEIEMVDGKPKMKLGEANNEAKEKTRIEYKNGKLVDNEENRKKFIKYMNIFNNANKDGRIVAEVRDRIRQDLMRNLGLDYEEASFAERWAFNKTLPMGIGARADTDASAFDAVSRGINTLPYRLKQYMKKRKGQVGNVFDFELVKRTGLTPLEEITDVHGRTVIEALQGGEASDYHSENPFNKKGDNYKKLTFGQDEGQRWSSMAFLNGEVIRKLIMEGKGFDIDQLVNYDQYGRPVIDQQKADEFLDKIQKAMRYKWCTWGGTDYSKTSRVMEWKRVDEFENGRLKIDRNGERAFHYESVWRDVPTLAAYFGPDIIGFVKNDIERTKQRTGKTDKDLREDRESRVWEIEGIGGDNKIDVSQVQNTQIRDFLWKQIEKGFVGKTLEAHRNVFSELSRHGYVVVEKFYDFFRAKDIWDKEDEKEVRKLSKTRELRLLGEEIPSSFLLGLLAGAWKEIRKEAPKVVSKAA